jgi:5'-methylthioadenosine phosphorylase
MALDKAELLKEIIGNLRAATENAMSLIRRAVLLLAERAGQNRLAASPAHDALSLAIWSDKQKIDPEEIRRLEPLWGRYFGSGNASA